MDKKKREKIYPHHLNLRLDEEDFKRLTALQEKIKGSKSDVVRKLLKRDVIVNARITSEEAKLLSDILKFKNNLNQVTKIFNAVLKEMGKSETLQKKAENQLVDLSFFFR